MLVAFAATDGTPTEIMAKAAAVLGVFMLDNKGGYVRAGTLARDADGAVSSSLRKASFGTRQGQFSV